MKSGWNRANWIGDGMSALDRKARRDLWRMKGQAAAIALVLGCGVATFVMSVSAWRTLASAQEQYYESHRFAHVFGQLKRAPNALAGRIAEIPGVARVQTRVVLDVTVEVPGMLEPAVGRLVSIPDRGVAGLNELYLRQGRQVEPGRRGEVLVHEAFAEAHGLGPGDSLQAVINGRLERLRVVGVALSPEFIYPIRPGELFPDSRRFGVFWMAQPELAPAHDLEGAFNNVVLTLQPGAVEAEIVRRVDVLTAPYGGQGAHGRSEQTSHRFVTDEMSQLRAMATVPPVIFLLVAAFLLNVVLSRVIGTQREQIAALKAFGYSRAEVGGHYLWQVMWIVMAGALFGVGFGAWLGRGMTGMYAEFFRFPVIQYTVDLTVLLPALAISGVAGLLGAWGAVRRAMLLPAAEAMRPEPPASYRPTAIERLRVQEWFSQSARMVLRELERKPGRAAVSTLGIALAIAILILGSFSKDLVDHIIQFQFHDSQRQDVTVTLVEPSSRRALHELRALPGVWRAEPFRTVPVRLRSGHLTRRAGIMGLTGEQQLYRVLNADGTMVTLPEEGLVLSDLLAEWLQVEPGDRVWVEVLEGHRPVRELTVTGLIQDYSGASAYMKLDAVNRFMREDRSISGAFLAVDSGQLDAFHRRLREAPRVAAVSLRRAALATFEALMDENLLRMRLINVFFGSVIAFGVVYNTARITLSERSRELATLRVIGFSRAEISRVLLGEIAVLTVAAIPLGLVLGYGLAALAVEGLQTETQRFPLVVAPATYGFAVVVTLVATLVSALVVRRRLDRLDLVAVLKARE
jgi:putative ABC transport system permease protein